MKSKILILLVFAVSLIFNENQVLAQPYPTIFIHGHNEDGWTMWDNLLAKLPAKEKHYIDAGGYIPWKGDNQGCISLNSCAKDSVWLFDYYKVDSQCSSPSTPVLETDKACRGKIGSPKDLAGNVVLRDSLAGESGVWGDGKTYNTVRSYASNLSTIIDQILKLTGASRVNIVAHSMGGLVTRAYINWYGGAGKVYKVLFLGTPNAGASDVAEHVAQYGLIAYWEAFGNAVINEGSPPDVFWQRIGEDLEMYPKTVDNFTFGNESKPPPTILGKNLPKYQGKSWIEWLSSVSLSQKIGLGRYATIAGQYSQQLKTIAGAIKKVNICFPGYLADCCFAIFGNCVAWPGTCGCCGFSIACISMWDIINDMLKGKPIPDDGSVNISEVLLAGAAFNDVIKAVHGRMPSPFDNIPEEEILTECSYTAKKIKDWLFVVDLVTCGDKACDVGEVCDLCSDCGQCPVVCGDKKCVSSESCSTCATDCGACPAKCGDAKCDPGENCKNCSADCKCGSDQVCLNNGSCCQKNCSGKQCGDDGCGSSCGGCISIPEVTPICKNNKCEIFSGGNYADPGTGTASSAQGGGDSIPFYKFKPYKFVYLPPLINPETDKQLLQVQGAPFDLKNLMPQKGPYDSVGQEKEPDFFLQFPGESNALEVYAIDYESTNNVVVAAILAEVTEGGPYTHDFATCARYAGYSLDDVKVVTINDAYYYEAVLSKSSELVYAVSFYLLINLDEVIVDSVWINDSVGVPQDQVVINVQIWTVNPEETEKMVTAFLANVENQIFGLEYVNNIPKEAPNTFFKTAKVNENGSGIEVSIFNRCKLEEIKIDELLWPKAGDSQFSVSYSVVLSAGDQGLYIPHPQLDSAVIYLQNASQTEFKDKIYLNKPLNPCNLNPQAWWSYNDAAVGGDSIIEITTSIPDAPQNPHKENVFLEIPSSVHLEGKVTTAYQYGFVGYGISLSSCQNTVDLSSVEGLSFMVRGDGKTYRVKLESASIGDYDYYGFNFTAPSDWTYIEIPFSSLSQEGWGVAKPFSASDVLNFSFQTVGQPYESVLLEVSDVVFYQKTIAQEAELQIIGLVPYLSLDNIPQTFTLIGTGFDNEIEIYVGGNKLEITLISENYLQFNVSGMVPGSYDLEIYSSDQAPIVLENVILIVDSQNEGLETDLCTQVYIAPVEPPILVDVSAEKSEDLSVSDAKEFAPEPDVVEIVDANVQDTVVAMSDILAEDKNSNDIADIPKQLALDTLNADNALAISIDTGVVGEDLKDLFDAIFYDSVEIMDSKTKDIDTSEENIVVDADAKKGIDTQHLAGADSIIAVTNEDTKSVTEIVPNVQTSTGSEKGDNSGCSYSTSNNFKPIYCLLVLIVFTVVRKRRFII